MQKIRHWLHRPLVHRCFMVVFVASTAYLCSMLLAGCGLPTWLSDGPGIIKAILTTITSVVSAIGALDPGWVFRLRFSLRSRQDSTPR